MAVVSLSREVSIKQFQIYAHCQGENASQMAEIVKGAYGANTVTPNYVQSWFRLFRSAPSSKMSIKSQKQSKLTGMLVVVASSRT
ncbi:hypothetical protein TNCV_877041 [Trichonephila clavipes]|nr:hypothetical protein TNCV_877041 [Trichonephila clavipes]